MMSLSNNNLVYMMVTKENATNSPSTSDSQALTQGQFPTYSAVTSPHTRVTQMMTNVAKPSLVSDIDNPVKSPVNKTSIISIVKGSGASNQQIFVRKSSNDSSNDGQNRNDVQLIHPRTPVGENPNHHIYVRKNTVSSLDLANESQNRNNLSDGHHTRISSSESFSPNMPMSSQQPPSYIDATQYTHQEAPHSSYQVQPQYEMHRTMIPAVEKKTKRTLLQSDKKVHIVHDSRQMELQGERSNRTVMHQHEQKNHMYDSPRQMYQMGESKSQQKHEAMRVMQQHEPSRSMQQHEGKTQRIRDSARTLYHVGEQKNQQIHYQLADQKNQPIHEQPLYLLSDQKNQQVFESGRSIHQVEQKGQQVHEPSRSIYQHIDQKTQQIHESSRTTSHQHNESKSQQGQHNEQKIQHESSRTSQHGGDQKQIHVHKVHHGNARVKYVEFKPIQQDMKYRQMMHHSPRTYNPNMKQTLYYSNHIASSPGNHHLSVQTQQHSPLSPLHSPPALRPPPTIPSGTAWHSPPSLVPSPEVRPRFDFISSPQPVTTAGSPHPVQVANMVPHKMYSSKDGKQINLAGNHNILLPRLPANYQLGSPSHQTSLGNVVPRSKATFIQTPTSNPTASQQPIYENNQSNFSQSGAHATSVATTVTVTMTYIPIRTSTKDKFVYVPVNSGQPVVLYQNQQASGKPVLLPQQVIQTGKNVPIAKDPAKDSAYTTVRLQGLVNAGTVKNANFTNVPSNNQTSPMKSMKYHHANTQQMSNHSFKKQSNYMKIEQRPSSFNIDQFDLEKEKNSLTPSMTKDFENSKKEEQDNIQNSMNQGEVMTLINNQLRLVPPQIGVNNQGGGTKRNSVGLPISNNNVLQSPTMSAQDEPSTSAMNDLSLDAKESKKRGRPATAEKVTKKGKKKDKGKKSPTVSTNLFNNFPSGNTDPNQVLIETYRKQQQAQLQKHYFEDPLLKLPQLPPTPESWTADDVHQYLLATDCACYADAIKAEEIDGKSFLLLTREALMDFLGVKLGPALKIAGHAAGLRARQRVYCLTMQEQKPVIPVVHKEKKVKLPPKMPVKQPEIHTSNSTFFNNSYVPVNSVATKLPPPDQLIIPSISILPPPEEKDNRPVMIEPSSVVSEPSPVILKVPNPLPLILGESGGSMNKLNDIEINGEIEDEVPTVSMVTKNSEEALSLIDNITCEDLKTNSEKTPLDVLVVPDLTGNNLFDPPQKTLSPPLQQSLLPPESESNGISHGSTS